MLHLQRESTLSKYALMHLRDVCKLCLGHKVIIAKLLSRLQV